MKNYTTALVPLLALTGCLGNQKGILAAERVGDVSNPAAQRVSAALELERACTAGAAASPVAAALRRKPYLQEVTMQAASVVYTTSVADTFVEVTRPDGSLVGRFPAAVDAAGTDPAMAQRSARVEGLEPASIYCYEVRDGSELPLTTRTGFRTAPEPGKGAPVRFAAWGDCGSGDADQLAVAEQIGSVPLDLMLVAGDIVYDGASRELFETRFFDVYQPLLRNFPVFPVSGNHEYDSPDARPYREVFRLPENADGDAGRERWYSYDYGDVHFVGLDSERVSAEQSAWLDRDLAATSLPWKVVMVHKPPYSTGEHGSDLSVREAFGPILERHGVQLVLTGHDHHYERVYPQNGVSYVVTGAGGAGVRSVAGGSFTAFGLAVLHYVYVEVRGDQLALHAIDGTGTEFDSFVLHR